MITKLIAAKAGRMADERKQSLVEILVRELDVDEVALVGALRKQTRVPLLDPADVVVDPEALRLVARDVCVRLKILPLSIQDDSTGKVLRIAMADPTDTTAIAEIEEITRCEIELTALPLSAVEELVARGYTQITTAVTTRPTRTQILATRRIERESETSETVQIPVASIAALRTKDVDDVELRLTALVEILMGKGLITEEELAEALRKRGV
ncbi:MAG: hypothetical protein NT062_28415 [Proteobacteria bacterium]|nr:hypothetical protein [Pseudomonadota bacterium]